VFLGKFFSLDISGGLGIKVKHNKFDHVILTDVDEQEDFNPFNFFESNFREGWRIGPNVFLGFALQFYPKGNR